MQNKQLLPEELESFKKAYALCSNEELSIMFDLSKKQIKRFARLFNLRKDEKIKRSYMRNVAMRNLGKANTDVGAQKRMTGIRKMIAKERLRIKYGLPQKTKKIITALSPREVLQAARRRYYLRSKGYIINDCNSKNVYYNNETKRSAKIEQHFNDFGYSFNKL